MKKTIDEKEIKRIEELLKGANGVLVMTNKGGAIVGCGVEILNLFANIGAHLKEAGFKEDDLKEALEIGFNAEKISLDEDKLKDLLKSGLKGIKDILDEVLGDDE